MHARELKYDSTVFTSPVTSCSASNAPTTSADSMLIDDRHVRGLQHIVRRHENETGTRTLT